MKHCFISTEPFSTLLGWGYCWFKIVCKNNNFMYYKYSGGFKRTEIQKKKRNLFYLFWTTKPTDFVHQKFRGQDPDISAVCTIAHYCCICRHFVSFVSSLNADNS